MATTSNAWQAKYNKVKALAERGIDGERDNARQILARMDAERKKQNPLSFLANNAAFQMAARIWSAKQ